MSYQIILIIHTTVFKQYAESNIYIQLIFSCIYQHYLLLLITIIFFIRIFSLKTNTLKYSVHTVHVSKQIALFSSKNPT